MKWLGACLLVLCLCGALNTTAASLSAADCLACHATGVMGAPKVDAAGFAHSRHAALSCVTCHASIASLPHPAQIAPVTAKTCAGCHAAAYRSYLLTAHGQAATLGLADAPTCASCHDPHLALPPTDPASRISPAHRLATCRGCHTGADPKLTGYDPHPQPGDPAKSALVTWAHYFMVALLAGVFGFFGLHTVLWLQRSFVGRVRGELPPLRHFGGPHIRRFTVTDRITHVVVILSFMLLALTGLPLMHPQASWAPALTRFWGGVRAMEVIHLVNAAITFGYFFFHLCYLTYRVLVKKQRYRLFGEDSLIPNWTDIKDIGRNFLWFLYLGPQPKMDRWTYWEKFDYWAVFWGVAIIGASGLLLAAPVFFTRFIPGIWLNVSFVVHSEEALLATGFIFIFHFFHNHLRPQNFPIDVAIFTGRVPLDRFKDERPLQYERLVSEGRLEQSIVPPPSAFMTVISVIFGAAVVLTGVTLIALVIFAG
ncbi:MAG TPA: multiheme c-type cytochrome [Steroidobacteraceae bacterium]|nr:multiheme c-type cytochrome [Steroidobacteraceae bacterium]